MSVERLIEMPAHLEELDQAGEDVCARGGAVDSADLGGSDAEEAGH